MPLRLKNFTLISPSFKYLIVLIDGFLESYMYYQKFGGISAIALAFTYVFGFILFFGILNIQDGLNELERLDFMLNNRDAFYIGYLVIGVLFSFLLMFLVQVLSWRFKQGLQQINHYASAVGYIWATCVLISSLIFLTSLAPIAKYKELDPQQGLIIKQTVSIVVNALGGGIELVGALWVLLISYLGLRLKVYHFSVHWLGIIIGVVGVLTLFSGLSFLSSYVFFDFATAVFGLGQIIWFLVLGVLMIKAN